MKVGSIREMVMYYRGKDPCTPVTEYAIRKLVADGAIRYCKVGTKTIVSEEAINEYFSGQVRTCAQLVEKQNITGGKAR